MYCHINPFQRVSSVARPLPGGEKRTLCGPHITRNYEVMVPVLLTCATTGLSLSAVWWLTDATPRGQPWTPAVTRLHGRDGLSARRMAVFCTFRTPSLCRHVHRELMHNTLLNLTLIVPATAYRQRSCVETYSRYMPRLIFAPASNAATPHSV